MHYDYFIKYIISINLTIHNYHRLLFFLLNCFIDFILIFFINRMILKVKSIHFKFIKNILIFVTYKYSFFKRTFTS